MPNETLKLQLERARFERALEIAESIAEHHHQLSTAELARMNNILTGKKEDVDPWRTGPVTLQLPSGRTETLAIVADPKTAAREKLHLAAEIDETGDAIAAAVRIYVELVLAHVFEDANRRTAVLAAHYYLKKKGLPASGLALHEMTVGDLRDADQVALLRAGIEKICAGVISN